MTRAVESDKRRLGVACRLRSGAMGSENSSGTWLLPFRSCLAALLLWASACGSPPSMDAEGELAVAEPAAEQTAPPGSTPSASVGDLPPTPTVAFADVVNIWLFQIGLRGPSSLEEWRERLERVCDAPIWESEPAARIATEFVSEDGGDPAQPGFLQEAVFALWSMARQPVVCGDRFPPDADDPPPVGYKGIAPDT